MARQVNGHLGTFASIEALTAKFPPSESIGCSANVGTAIPYTKAWCDGSEWALVKAPQIQALVSGAWNPLAASLSLADCETQWPASRSQSIVLPNPYPTQDNTPVHCSLLSFASQWGGYKYWMAYTPYPGADSLYENPCVAASNDRVTWVAQGAQPLVPHPGGTTYNADTHLFMSADEGTMYLAFRERSPTVNTLYVMQTSDGVVWTAPVAIETGANGTQDFGSPSIWWNGTGWTMISHNLDAVSPWPVQRWVSNTANIYEGFGSPVTVIMPVVAGRAWWHSCMVRALGNAADGRIIGIAQDNAGTAGGSGNLYYIESADDGATFARLAAVSSLGGKYRSAVYPRRTPTGMVVDVVVGTLAGANTLHEALPVRRALADAAVSIVNAVVAAGSRMPPGVVLSDSCVRTDSAVTPNPSSSGVSYTVSSGTWGISTNRLHAVASGRLLVAAGTPTHRISARFEVVVTGVQMWLIARAVDGSNYYRAGIVSPVSGATVHTLTLQSIVSGNFVEQQVIGTITTGDYLTIDSVGGLLRVTVNGQLVGEYVANRFSAGASVAP